MAKIKQNSVKPENIFILFALIFGTIWTFMIPPFQVADEYAHFYRTYQISRFQFIGHKKDNAAGGYIPKKIIEMVNSTTQFQNNREKRIYAKDLIKDINIKADYTKQTFVDFRNTVLYFPSVYTPQAIGFWVVKKINVSPFWLLCSGRILNLAAYILMVYFAIKKIPVFKWGLTMLALMPMTLYQASSLSCDAQVIAIGFLLISLILETAYSKDKKVSNKRIILIAILTFFMGMSKIAYCLIPFLFLIIPKSKFKTDNKYFVTFASIISTMLLGMFLWMLTAQQIYVQTNPNLPVNPQAQLLSIITSPQVFTMAVLNNIISPKIYHSFAGNLGWLDNSLPVVIVLIYLTFLLMCGFFENNKKINIDIKQKFISLAIIILSVFFIEFSIYLTWNAVGAKEIIGIQGRYMIPFAPIVFLLMYNNKLEKFKKPCAHKIIIAIMLFTLIFSTYTILNRYYIF